MKIGIFESAKPRISYFLCKRVLRLCAIALALSIGAIACSEWEPSGSGASSASSADSKPVARPLAFKGAEGYGKYAQGGRGGRIIAVTSLEDSGPGTLRNCIEAKGPRTCIFRVSGIIRYTTRRPVIRNPHITIAGQTAPGAGILLTHNGGEEGQTPLVIKDTYDVVIRHIRVRTDKKGVHRGSNDGITIENSHDVIVDHVSVSWAIDENIGTTGHNDAITISNSIFAEGKPPHDKCALLGVETDQPQKLSFVRNICAHSGDRNPEVNTSSGSCIDIINNVFYNGEGEFTEIWETFGGSAANLVGNYYKPGPNTIDGAPAIDRHAIDSKGEARIYLNGNIAEPPLVLETENLKLAISDEPVCPVSVDAVSAERAYEDALNRAGAFPHDAVDQRIVGEIRAGGGAISGESPDLPAILSDQAPEDYDGDGMPDAWETVHGSDAYSPDPWADADGNGVANLDDYFEMRHLAAMSQ